MIKKMGHVTVLVHDYDEAVEFYRDKVGFEVAEDIDFGPEQRWVTVHAPEQDTMLITFVKADTEEKKALVGKQAADHVFLTVSTDDCIGDYKQMKEKGVKFHGGPTDVPWGIEVVFEDLYGNRIDLVEPML
ncbi:VOC family protein [Alkalihalobacillus sp. AL-G]|uniref:VOC family protein n=1 Tax=Alkalihalobacillus sp. AL-G TaxID=2926399 RepID=UPI0027296FE9|nr:VOC family protein [Alkalihalobacillus sp. AL-G]WLD93909.1 VOC family protein [Alkalihalobacillus sp. AL-G]